MPEATEGFEIQLSSAEGGCDLLRGKRDYRGEEEQRHVLRVGAYRNSALTIVATAPAAPSKASPVDRWLLIVFMISPLAWVAVGLGLLD